MLLLLISKLMSKTPTKSYVWFINKIEALFVQDITPIITCCAVQQSRCCASGAQAWPDMTKWRGWGGHQRLGVWANWSFRSFLDFGGFGLGACLALFPSGPTPAPAQLVSFQGPGFQFWWSMVSTSQFLFLLHFHCWSIFRSVVEEEFWKEVWKWGEIWWGEVRSGEARE